MAFESIAASTQQKIIIQYRYFLKKVLDFRYFPLISLYSSAKNALRNVENRFSVKIKWSCLLPLYHNCTSAACRPYERRFLPISLVIWRFFFHRFTPDFLSWSAPKHRKDQFIFECCRPLHIRVGVASLLWQRQAVRKQLTGHFSRLCLPPVTSGGKINGLFCAKPLPLSL